MPLDIFLNRMSHYMYMHLDIYRRSRHRGPSSRALKGTPMDTEDTQNNDENRGDSIRPFGYWLRTLDALITTEFDKALEGEGVTRRDWMVLNVIAGDVDAPGFAERLARKGKRLRGLEQRGWATETGDGSWVLTDEGRAAKERLGAVVDGVRARVAGAVAPEDYATTVASLEAIARALGWDENARMPRSGFGQSFGRGFGRGFGPGPFGPDIHHGYGPNLHRGFRPGFGPGGGPTAMPDDEHCGHGHHGEHGHDPGHGHRGEPGGFGHTHRGRSHHGGGQGRGGERAYERGFVAGFAHGREV